MVSYGGNLRFNQSDLSIAPAADNRQEFGGYAQDEIFLSNLFRWIVGARVDHFDYLNDFVFSPRTTFMIKPRADQAIRFSYNRAYRSPSVINNFLDLVIAQPIDLGLFSPALAGRIYPLPVSIQGNPDLKEQSLDAFEIGYTGALLKRATVSAAFYVNNLKNDILFTQDRSVRLHGAEPSAGLAAAAGGDRGGARRQLSGPLHLPELRQEHAARLRARRERAGESRHRRLRQLLLAGHAGSEGLRSERAEHPGARIASTPASTSRTRRFLGDLSVNYSGSAFWQDVLDDPYHGTTEAYTLVNGGFGVRWADSKVTTSVKVINLANQDVQQHVFGDILKRQVVGEMRVQF